MEKRNLHVVSCEVLRPTEMTKTFTAAEDKKVSIRRFEEEKEQFDIMKEGQQSD